MGAWTVRCLKMDKVCLFVVGIRGAGSHSGTGSEGGTGTGTGSFTLVGIYLVFFFLVVGFLAFDFGGNCFLLLTCFFFFLVCIAHTA